METKDPYIYHDSIYNLRSPEEIVPIIMTLYKPVSVLDVGCGTGTWLKVFEKNGVTDFLGVDFGGHDTGKLMIDKARFISHDLRQELHLERTYDLVLSLEVAEHLPASAADRYVRTLVNHGEIIIFSAAVPGQGGQDHVNEQWPEYWRRKFESHGYYFHDVIRPRIWENAGIHHWYRQNIFVVRKQLPADPSAPLSIIHPELFRQKIADHASYVDSLFAGKQGLLVSTRIFLNALWFKLTHLFE